MIKVLVIGESCIDRFIYCDVSRLSPEAPVPILKPINFVENPGMSGNVVENLKSLSKNLEIEHIFQPEEITKTRYVESKSNHMFLRVDEGEYEISSFEDDFETNVNFLDYDITIVSDYNKGFLSDRLLKYIGLNSNISILDSKRKLSKEIIESFSFVKLNENEMKQNLELSKLENIIVTLGSKGAKFKDTTYPSPNPKETIDVSGAGDTFTASFILKFYDTNNVGESIDFANKMSSIVVSKRGVSTP